ncbi:hypothetical protein ACN38_g9111 [Penicillium nordicum]|uniref:Uncharacterized protein n=1 Tax=Penicillium nordicum TaxID=229535 RepID=A0A0M8P3Q1_9EURO|nr:hypothetical protein ACN38_g9111 [Penicillium nordicum]
MLFAYEVIRLGFSITPSFSPTPSSSICPSQCPVPAFLEHLKPHLDISDTGWVHGGDPMVAHLAPSFDTQCVRHGSASSYLPLSSVVFAASRSSRSD